MPRRYCIKLKDPKTQAELTAHAEAVDQHMLLRNLFAGERPVQGWVVTSVRDLHRNVSLVLPVSEADQLQALQGAPGARMHVCESVEHYCHQIVQGRVMEGLRTIYG